MLTQERMFAKQDGLLTVVTNMVESVTTLVGQVAGLADQMTLLLKSHGESESKGAPPQREVTMESNMVKSMTYAAIVQAKLDSESIEEKAKNMVVLNFGELDGEGQLLNNDEKLLNEIVHAVGDEGLVKKLKAGKIKCRRHPADRPPSQRGRPLKIFLESQADRDLVLGFVRRNKTPLMRNNYHLYCRRDYTRAELETDRDLRRRAGIINAAEEQLAYVVRDFNICKLPNPRPLPPNRKRDKPPSKPNG